MNQTVDYFWPLSAAWMNNPWHTTAPPYYIGDPIEPLGPQTPVEPTVPGPAYPPFPYIPSSPPTIPMPMYMGWQCPRCNTINAPFITKCHCSYFSSTSDNTG